jgi:hypothetical protein
MFLAKVYVSFWLQLYIKLIYHIFIPEKCCFCVSVMTVCCVPPSPPGRAGPEDDPEWVWSTGWDHQAAPGGGQQHPCTYPDLWPHDSHDLDQHLSEMAPYCLFFIVHYFWPDPSGIGCPACPYPPQPSMTPAWPRLCLTQRVYYCTSVHLWFNS